MLPLLDLAERQMADTSLDAYQHICLTLAEREVSTFLLVCDYIAATGHQDVTGMELAHWSGVSVLSLRPRLTGLTRKGWCHSHGKRASRRPDELTCHPVSPALPREAVARVQRKRSAA